MQMMEEQDVDQQQNQLEPENQTESDNRHQELSAQNKQVVEPDPPHVSSQDYVQDLELPNEQLFKAMMEKEYQLNSNQQIMNTSEVPRPEEGQLDPIPEPISQDAIVNNHMQNPSVDIVTYNEGYTASPEKEVHDCMELREQNAPSVPPNEQNETRIEASHHEVRYQGDTTEPKKAQDMGNIE